ncbi:MAG: 50S ribosomal protein L19 [SAR116 cluster bacterium]|jgi:large subunit ribosomal protein L19|nr:50S ribosomal protein L19 [SAR116 cluster bacterium]|tara:strand:- start:2899 stop:3396 length:498 start_codon:yes stop_codon:yes gene_type:complete
MNIIEKIEKSQIEKIQADRNFPEFNPGDTIKVDVKVIEGTRERVQAFEGVCIAKSGSGINRSFTVRKISYGEGVERVFPFYSPKVAGITLLRKGRVRRAKLYYLRSRRGKSARIVEKIEIKNKDINLKKQNLKSNEKIKVTEKKTKLENKKETLAEKPKDEKKDK